MEKKRLENSKGISFIAVFLYAYPGSKANKKTKNNRIALTWMAVFRSRRSHKYVAEKIKKINEIKNQCEQKL